MELTIFTSLILIVIIALLQELVEASGTIEIKLLSYANPDHRLYTGKCCEQGMEKNCTRVFKNVGCEKCTMECDPQFRIEINQTNNQIFFQETLTLSYKDNFDFEEELKANITNPFAVKLDSFQGEFTLSIKSYDDDTPNFDVFDLIDESLLTFNTSLIAPTNTTQLQSISGTVTTTNFTIRITCDADFYGPFCDAYCMAQDNNIDGHYNCNLSTGEKICLQGWESPTSNCTLNATKSVTSSVHSSSSTISVFPTSSMGITDIIHVEEATPALRMTETVIIEASRSKTVHFNSALLLTTLLGANTFGTTTTTPTLRMTKTVLVEASRSKTVQFNSAIVPTSSSDVLPMASSSSTPSCDTTVKAVHMDLKFQGELNLKELNETIDQIICIEVNRGCYKLHESQCQKPTGSRESSGLTHIEVSRQNFTNDSHIHFKIVIHSAAGRCNDNFEQCTRQSIYTSKHLRQQFGVKTVEICSTSEDCEQRATLLSDGEVIDGKKDNQWAIVVIPVVCAIVGLAVVLLGVLYIRKKRLMKVQNLDSLEKTDIVPADDDKDTSLC